MGSPIQKAWLQCVNDLNVLTEHTGTTSSATIQQAEVRIAKHLGFSWLDSKAAYSAAVQPLVLKHKVNCSCPGRTCCPGWTISCPHHRSGFDLASYNVPLALRTFKLM